MAGFPPLRQCECGHGMLYGSADVAACRQYGVRHVGITQKKSPGGCSVVGALTWNVFSVSLVHECQYDQGYCVQRIFVITAGEPDGSSYGGPQEYPPRDPGSAIRDRNRRNDSVSE